MRVVRPLAGLALGSAVFFAAWAGKSQTPAAPKAVAKAATTKAGAAKAKAAVSKGPPLTADQRAAQALMRSMTLRDRVAQLVIAVCDGDVYSTHSKEYQKYAHWIRDLRIGGLIVNNAVQYGLVRNAQPHTMAVFLNQMQRMAKVPLLVASDFERAASMRVTGGTRFPHNMAFGAAGDLAATRFEGLTAAREARALGVHWIFAPVADVNNNPRNPIINLRSYGEDPEQVARHVTAFIEGAHSDSTNRILVTAKHFPGHGDTDVDSHLGLPRLGVDRARLDSIELRPFQAAIAHGVDSIMTAHVELPSVDPEEVPATVSGKILTNMLRDELKFRNLIVTDAMDMLGLALKFDSGEGSIRALRAGADVLLMPPDPERAIDAVVAAILSGRLSRQRVEQSVLRVLTAKVQLGLTRKKLVNLDAISDALDSPEAADRAQAVADHAVTLVRNRGGVLPLSSAGGPCLLVVTELRISQFGQRMLQEFRRRAPSGRALAVDTSLPLAALDSTFKTNANGCSAVAVASFAGVSADLRDIVPFVQGLSKTLPVVILALGNPYLLTTFPEAPAYLATFSTMPPSEVAGVKALFGEIPIRGRMPVSIPDFANLGDGIDLYTRNR
jgi:beta-N-acetylhexosaminidase